MLQRLWRSNGVLIAIGSLGLLLALGSLSQLVPGWCGPRPVVWTWKTESEIDTLGFNLQRAENASGPFIKVNHELIPSQVDPVVHGEYHFTDDQVQAGKTYVYRLEEVDTHGATTTLTQTLTTVEPKSVRECLVGW